MKTESLLVEKRETIGIITLHRPEKGNSLTVEMLERLEGVFQDLAGDPKIRSVIIRGSGGRMFCSGYDINALPVKAGSGTLKNLKAGNPLERALSCIETYPYPVIAMVNGHAFGAGCELAMACDFRIGADHVKMGMPPAKIGIVYPAAGLQRFLLTIGRQNTRRLFYTGEPVSGKKLVEAGLLDDQVRRSELETVVFELAARISGNAPLALQGMKRILYLLGQRTELSDSDQAAADALVAEAFQSDDLKEGQTAFLEKRKPVFTGK